MLYGGAVLPDISGAWEEAKAMAMEGYGVDLPYVVLSLFDNVLCLIFSVEVPVFEHNPGVYRDFLFDGPNYMYVLDDNTGQWVYETKNIGGIGLDPIYWSNFDIIDTIMGYLHRPASEPVPVGNGMVAYGFVLPDINTVWTDELKKTHPYAVLVADADYPEYIYLAISPYGHWTDDCVDLYWYGSEPNQTGQAKLYSYNVSENPDSWLDYDYMDEMVPVSILWSNVDIYDWEKMKVTFATSPDPVPVGGTTDLRPVYLRENGKWVKKEAYERQNGKWVLISSAEEKAETPTMLYNGVELPNINTVWTDKETYPYAAVVKTTYGITLLVISENMLRNDSLNIWGNGSINVYGLEYNIWVYGYSDDILGDEEFDGYDCFYIGANVIWANHVVYFPDITMGIYLTATDPVPV